MTAHLSSLLDVEACSLKLEEAGKTTVGASEGRGQSLSSKFHCGSEQGLAWQPRLLTL